MHAVFWSLLLFLLLTSAGEPAGVSVVFALVFDGIAGMLTVVPVAVVLKDGRVVLVTVLVPLEFF